MIPTTKLPQKFNCLHCDKEVAQKDCCGFQIIVPLIGPPPIIAVCINCMQKLADANEQESLTMVSVMQNKVEKIKIEREKLMKKAAERALVN